MSEQSDKTREIHKALSGAFYSAFKELRKLGINVKNLSLFNNELQKDSVSAKTKD